MAESDSENAHPPKRPRLEPNLVEDECEEKQPVTRSKYWFETGDVILHVQNTQLRVHREILALHSAIFKDMFNMPQSKENVLDGPPVVVLDDGADDIEYMLSIFYDSVKKHDWSKPMRLVHVSALLRLRKKYEIDFFVEQALKCLRVDHPTSLADWETITFPDRYKKIESNGENDDLEDIIALANEHSVPSILPVAYLRLVLRYPLEIFISEETMPRLSLVDRDNRIVGRDKLSKELLEKRTQWLRGKGLVISFEHCGSSSSSLDNVCDDIQWEAVERFQLWNGCDSRTTLLPLSKRELSWFCPKCAKAIRGKHDEIREEVWKTLPIFFQLSRKWEDLKDFDG